MGCEIKRFCGALVHLLTARWPFHDPGRSVAENETLACLPATPR